MRSAAPQLSLPTQVGRHPAAVSTHRSLQVTPLHVLDMHRGPRGWPCLSHGRRPHRQLCQHSPLSVMVTTGVHGAQGKHSNRRKAS